MYNLIAATDRGDAFLVTHTFFVVDTTLKVIKFQWYAPRRKVAR